MAERGRAFHRTGSSLLNGIHLPPPSFLPGYSGGGRCNACAVKRPDGPGSPQKRGNTSPFFFSSFFRLFPFVSETAARRSKRLGSIRRRHGCLPYPSPSLSPSRLAIGSLQYRERAVKRSRVFARRKGASGQGVGPLQSIALTAEQRGTYFRRPSERRAQIPPLPNQNKSTPSQKKYFGF